jgi:hypothetical protein
MGGSLSLWIFITINLVHVVKLHGDVGAGAATGFDMGL